MKYKYSIIESEKSIIKNLHNCFKKFPEYTCVGASNCYNESLDLILEHAPSIVFVNVDGLQNNDSTAFNFINGLYHYMEKLPFIIALSNSTELAYTSLKNNFFDYLLKPINEFELRKSISRLNKISVNKLDKLCLKSYKDYRFLDIDEILFLKADNNTSDIFMNDGSTVSAYKTLKTYETILPENFIRIHNSYIINQNYVSRIHFGKSECSLKKSSYHIPFSKLYRNNVIILEKTLSKKALLSLN